MKSIEELESQIERIPAIPDRVDAYNRAAWDLRYFYRDAALQFCIRACALACSGEYEQAPYQKGLAAGLALKSVIYVIEFKLDRALEEAYNALKLIKVLQDLQAEYDAKASVAWQNLQHGDYQAATQHARAAIRGVRTVQDLQAECDARAVIAWCNIHHGDYQTATQYARAALKIAQKIQDREREIGLLDALANLSCKAGKYDQALQFHDQEFRIAEELQDPAVTMISYNNRASTYLEMGDPDQALQNILLAIELAKKLEMESEIVITTNSLALILLKMDKIAEAENQCQWAYSMFEELGLNQPNTKMFLLYTMAEIKLEQKRYTEAEEDLLKALKAVEDRDYDYLRMVCHARLAHIYECIKMPQKSLNHRAKQSHAIEQMTHRSKTEPDNQH